jgi:hypothetical protein
MSASLPNGTIFSLAASYAAAIPFTILSNAAPPQATATAHGLTNGDILEVTSGWPLLNDRPARVAGSTANTFNLEGHDSTDLTRFPAGSGLGSVRKVLTWQQISQVMQNASSGGEQQSVEWVYLEDGIERSKNTFRKAKVLTLTLADDAAQAWNAVLLAADQDGKNRILRAQLPSGGSIYYNVNVGFDPEPMRPRPAAGLGDVARPQNPAALGSQPGPCGCAGHGRH